MKVAAIALSILLGIAAAFFYPIFQPGPSGIATSLRLPDGSEYMVTQRCNWSPEPYTVAFYMRTAGGAWGWCYIDHEADRWWNVKMAYDTATDIITVTERGVRRAALDRQPSTFWIDNGSIKRELSEPQELREPEFAFHE